MNYADGARKIIHPNNRRSLYRSVLDDTQKLQT